MSSAGRYVRLHHSGEGGSENGDCEASEYPEGGRFVRAPSFDEVDSEDGRQKDGDEAEYPNDRYCIEYPTQENEMLRRQIADMQKVIDEITAMRKSSRQHESVTNDAEESWNCFRNTQLPPHSEGTIPTIRWEQIKSFPKNVPANKMWEEWSKYIENFEIAASLSNATDPVRRSQLLFLSMGEELQGIVRAAKLRPNLNNKECYTVFINNIEEYLRCMTDTAAEHEAFSCMQQKKEETVVSFHARLMEKVRMCRYSPSDQERFVKAQLLKGMTNRELAKSARTFGYDLNFIVQSAMRDEAYQIETAQATNAYEATVNLVRDRMSNAPFKRRSATDYTGGSQNKQARPEKFPRSSRRERCSRCNRWAHRNRPCPALKLKCNQCGKFGHFAVTCRSNRVNAVEESSLFLDAKNETKEEVK